MSAFELQILAADRPFYEGPCTSLIVPTPQGKYGILAHHANAVIALVPGMLSYMAPGKAPRFAAVSDGLVKIEGNRVLVLADSAERPQDINANRAKRAASAAQEAILQKKGVEEYRLAQARLARAMARLKVKGDYERRRSAANVDRLI